jgi:hypothetical protein
MLRQLEWDSAPLELHLPRTILLKSNWLQFSFLQYLLTARDSSEESTLVLAEPHADALTDLLEYTKSSSGRLAISFARNIRGAISGKDLTVERYSALNSSAQDPTAKRSDHPMKGRSVTLLCFDSIGALNNPWLYPQISGRVDPWGPDIFATVVDEIIHKLLQHFPMPGLLLSNASREIGYIVYELFLNTHDWGRHRLDNSFIPNSVRGVSFNLLASMPSPSSLPIPLRAYLSRVFETSKKRHNRFIVIGVLDGGEGLAARFANRRFGPAETVAEFETVQDCFKKHSTSTGREGRGIGLASVEALLRALKAFMRIRTGRLHLYQDFTSTDVANPKIAAGEDDFRVTFNDWNSLGKNVSANARVSGTLYEIFIPLVGIDQ